MQMKKNFEKSEKKITYAMFLHIAPIFLQQIKVKQYDIKKGRIAENGCLRGQSQGVSEECIS